MKRIKILLAMVLCIVFLATPVLAGNLNENEIITLGADLTDTQKNEILNELNSDSVKVIEVTNEEEHKYLDGIIPVEKIGYQALSSAKLILLNDGKGIDVNVSENITYITEDNYRNALITAGVHDAKVDVTAPMKVTGTGALTGIMKGYEVLTGEEIPDDVKKIANEELVITSDLSNDIGNDDATNLINDIKVAFSEKMPETEDEARTIVINISNEYNLNLTDEQVDKLVNLFMKMKNTEIDWEKVSETAKEYSKKAADYLSSEEGQSFLKSLKNIFISFVDWIASLFK